MVTQFAFNNTMHYVRIVIIWIDLTFIFILLPISMYYKNVMVTNGKRIISNFLDLDMGTVHLVGTGAGVPFVYFVGKGIQHKNIPIPGRITAIDAGPGFEYPAWIKDFKTLADYTEAMHTSVSYNGDNRPGRYVGYPNFILKNKIAL
jgi:hypothetical protein